MGEPRRRGLARVMVFGLLWAACATTGASPAKEQVTVSTAQPASVPTGFVLAAAVDGPASQPQPRPAPAGDPYRDALVDAYKSFKTLAEGKNADYIPILARVDPKLYGLVLVTVQGAVYEIGNAHDEFSIQSVSKPFTAARVIDTLGAEALHQRIGVNATGQKFNSILAIDLFKNIPSDKDHVTPAGNPLVNPGAIATVDMLPAPGGADKWAVIQGTLDAFAGRRLSVNDEVYRSESETNTHNRAIVQLLKDYEVIQGDPMAALDLYTRQCSVNVSARDLAVMGATLANGGKNPLTGVQVVASATAAKVLALVSTAGLYETSGEWLYKVGVPAKSGVGGGIVAVVPGRFAVGTFSPPLDAAGNSVRGQRAVEAIMQKLGGNVFASKPATHQRMTGAMVAPPIIGPSGAPAAGPIAAGGR